MWSQRVSVSVTREIPILEVQGFAGLRVVVAHLMLPIVPLAAGITSDAFTAMGAGDCCRTNGQMIFKTFNGFSRTPKGCEAECLATAACRFFSHAVTFSACAFCSACNLEQRGYSREYTSWARADAPQLSQASSEEPLLFTFLDHGERSATATLTAGR